MITPSACTGPDAAPLDAAQVAQWREQGAVVVDGLVPLDLVLAVRDTALALARPPGPGEPTDFGSAGRCVFPADCEAFNALTLHPRLLAALAQLLGEDVRNLRLTQSDLWTKWGREQAPDDPFDNSDQRMHVDYPNHTLLHPPPWDDPDAVEVIVYGTDRADCAGATRVVRRRGADDPAYPWPIVHNPGVGDLPWINQRDHAEEHLARHRPEAAQWRAEHLYRREEEVDFRVGSVLLYRHDVWHRGTPVRPAAVRVAHNLTFRRSAREWVSTLHEGWAWAMYRPGQPMERLIATLSADQRCVLGIPAPGDPYWTEATLAALQARYGAFGIDVREYRDAMEAPAN